MPKTLSLFAAVLIALGGLAAAPLTASAEPPPWAPAHGWRAKHGHSYGDRHHAHHPVEYERADPDHGQLGDPRRRPLFSGGGDLLRCNRELAGQVVGGAVGAIAGSGIGSGRGQLVATGTGALIGVLLGGEIGRALDRQDRACFGQTLETLPTGHTAIWHNPDTGARLRATPTQSYRTETGRPCREYTAMAVVGGRERQVYGTACRQPDGTWEIVG